jgi:integrase/recombinase XerC
LAANNYAASTERTYTETLLGFERRFPVFVHRVTHDLLVDYLTTDADGQATTRAPSTLDRQRATLRTFWRWATREGYVKVDPAEGLEHLYLGRGGRRLGRWLTRDEARRLLAVCEDDDQGRRDHTLLTVALLSGLRRSELANLRWRAVDLSNGRLTVAGKGAKLATIGLPDQAQDVLRMWRAIMAERQGRRAPGVDQPVFPAGRKQAGLLNVEDDYVFDWNKPISHYTVHTIVTRRADEAGLGTVAPHDLRRSFAGWLDEDGTGLQGIQAALRHGSPDVTARCYLDPSPRRAVEAVTNLRI